MGWHKSKRHAAKVNRHKCKMIHNTRCKHGTRVCQDTGCNGLKSVSSLGFLVLPSNYNVQAQVKHHHYTHASAIKQKKKKRNREWKAINAHIKGDLLKVHYSSFETSK